MIIDFKAATCSVSSCRGRCRPRRRGDRMRRNLLRCMSPEVADIVANVFLRCRTKILRAADAFCARRREGPYRLIQNRSRTSVVALKSERRSKDQLSRDYLDCSIFDFCDKQKSSCFRIVVETRRAAASLPWVSPSKVSSSSAPSHLLRIAIVSVEHIELHHWSKVRLSHGESLV